MPSICGTSSLFSSRPRSGGGEVQLEDLGRFANWLRLAPAERSGQLRRLTDPAEHCSATTINRKLSAVGSFYQFHQHHGANFEFLPLSRGRGSGGSWKPLLAHLGGSTRPGKELKRRTPARIPRTLSAEQVSAVLDACNHLRDRLLFALLAGTGMRIGEHLGFGMRILTPLSASSGCDPGGTPTTPEQRPATVTFPSSPVWCGCSPITCSTSTARWIATMSL